MGGSDAAVAPPNRTAAVCGTLANTCPGHRSPALHPLEPAPRRRAAWRRRAGGGAV